ncbi:MAG: hypothetical protein LBR80_03135 [Deltaproteobacteria bacterium]|jgi:hypothetical protein|nr:hypothetical protein [Deltaproteobacteria bacterium]
MFPDRIDLYRKIEEITDAAVIFFFTSDRDCFETEISDDAADIFIGQLEDIGFVPRLALVLHTDGGAVSSAWNIATLLREHCNELSVIVPRKALSAGTLICLAADTVFMKGGSALGPIDPAISVELIRGDLDGKSSGPVDVRIESVFGFLSLATEVLAIGDEAALASVLRTAAGDYRAHDLGEAFRMRPHIRMLAERLLRDRGCRGEQIDKIVDFLSRGSGSRDFTIGLKFAQSLGLPAKMMPRDLSSAVSTFFRDIRTEMGFFGRQIELRPEELDFRVRDGVEESAVKSVLIESFRGGSDRFVMVKAISSGKSGEVVADGIFGPDGESGLDVGDAEDGLDGEDGETAVRKGLWEHEKTQ